MSWSIAKPKLKASFNKAEWGVVHNQKFDVLVVTTLKGEMYFFGEDNNPDNSSGFTFNSLLESTPCYTRGSVEELIAWFIENN
jgi:hypothetical protein